MNVENNGIQVIESLRNHYQDINYKLLENFEETFPTPVIGIAKLKEILEEFGVNIPILFELDSEGDEFVLEIDDIGSIRESFNESSNFLYVIYIKEDTGYSYYSEITDLEGIKEILDEDDSIDV